METEKEVQEIKERLTNVENQLQQKRRSSGLLQFLIGFVVVFLLLLISIGVIHFISSSSS
ncbi:hypothetical protein [Paenibacillus agricola]|uniref:Uncharacterized protein n=1 Tax=Paenibacillus agricola TaxID=2716264 RepID=A0ABX0JAF5_9BACL|nr:hypothetical protein [Paenibacillus agricola]NHN33374.1 hypothetical protein [Paenibacillus agricola]